MTNPFVTASNRPTLAISRELFEALERLRDGGAPLGPDGPTSATSAVLAAYEKVRPTPGLEAVGLDAALTELVSAGAIAMRYDPAIGDYRIYSIDYPEGAAGEAIRRAENNLLLMGDDTTEEETWHFIYQYRDALLSLVPPNPPAPGSLSELRLANVERNAHWDPTGLLTLSFRGNELAGEVGEVCNVVKKLERERLGLRGSRDTTDHLAEELADVLICADLIGMAAGVDLARAVQEKFNATSKKLGLPTLMGVTP